MGQLPSGAPENNKQSYKTMLLAPFAARGTPRNVWQVMCAVPFGIISMVRGKGGCVGMDVGLSSYTRTEFVRLCRPHGWKHATSKCNEQDSVVHSPRGPCAMYPDQVLLKQGLFRLDDGVVGKMNKGYIPSVMVQAPEVYCHRAMAQGQSSSHV